jgi:hypothetical protein
MLKKRIFRITSLFIALSFTFLSCLAKNTNSPSSGGNSPAVKVSTATESDFQVKFTEDEKGASITGYTGTATAFAIPSMIQARYASQGNRV